MRIPVDLNEAYLVGREATSQAVDGESDKMVTLTRKNNEPYECESGLVELEKVALRTRNVPNEFISNESNFVSKQFLEYARPLIGGPLPEYAHLKRKKVEKYLSGPHVTLTWRRLASLFYRMS